MRKNTCTWFIVYASMDPDFYKITLGNMVLPNRSDKVTPNIMQEWKEDIQSLLSIQKPIIILFFRRIDDDEG